MSAETETHPSLFDLEAHHAGEGRAEVAAHAALCATCRGYLAELDGEAARFQAAARPDDFARAVRARAESAPPRHRTRFGLLVPGAAFAAAGALALWLFVPPRPAGPGGGGDEAREEIRLKGAPQLAVILLRDGKQSRQVGSVSGRPGDRFRVELTVPEAGEVEVVMVQAGRPMLAVVAPRRFETGTHLLEPTYDFDDQPTRARLLAGPPAAVRRVAAGGAPEPGVALVSLHGAGAAP